MPQHEAPCVSVICPVRNDPEGLKRTLRSLGEQHVSPDQFEVIVVDNGSTDDTFAVALAWLDETHISMRVVAEPEPGSYAARNRGVLLAGAPLLLFVDADVVLPPDWLRNALAFLAGEDDVHYLGCPIRVHTTGDDAGLAERYEQVLGFPVAWYLQQSGFAPTACLLVSRELIRHAGPFDAQLLSGGDLEFGQRVRELGYRQCYDPNNPVYHPARCSLGALRSKHRRVVRGLIALRRNHPQRYPCNRLKDLAFWIYQITPLFGPATLRRVSGARPLDRPLMLLIMYAIRLEGCWLKLKHRCLF